MSDCGIFFDSIRMFAEVFAISRPLLKRPMKRCVRRMIRRSLCATDTFRAAKGTSLSSCTFRNDSS